MIVFMVVMLRTWEAWHATSSRAWRNSSLISPTDVIGAIGAGLATDGGGGTVA